MRNFREAQEPRRKEKPPVHVSGISAHLPQQIERTLPKNTEAEKAILGAILLDNSKLPPLLEKLKSTDFLHNAHQLIYSAMVALEHLESPIDLITVSEYLEQKHQIDSIPGKAGYLASLLDGVPRIGNIDHYAQMVHEKALMRRVITGAEALKNKAFEGLATPADLQFEIDVLARELSNGNLSKRAQPIDFHELLVMDLKPRDYVVSPIFPTQGIVMCHAWRGTGKTWFGLELSRKIAAGPLEPGSLDREPTPRPIFSWNIPSKHRVLYVDGEMPLNALQDRCQKLIRYEMDFDSASIPRAGTLQFVTRDSHVIPNISGGEGQRFIEGFLEEDMVLFLDNLTSLAPGGKEGQEEWFPIQEWLLHLRHRGVHTWFFHHSGKSGTQRGASGREDVIDSTVQLRHPPDYNEAEGLRAEIHIEKMRGGPKGETAWPFEISFEENKQDGSMMLVHKPLKELRTQRAYEMFSAGMAPRDVMEDLHISRFAAYRLHQKWKIEKIERL